MAVISSYLGEEGSSQENAGGSDVPSTSSAGDGAHSSPWRRTVHEQQEAEKSHGENSERSGVGLEQDNALLSPRFRSAVAMAGWDAETLLMAALVDSPIDSESSQENFTGTHDLSAHDLSPAIQDGLRKRDTRTPSSSGQRPRKVRWENGNGHSIGRVPMQPLTTLPPDGEHDKLKAAKENDTQENRDKGAGTSEEDKASNGKEASSSTPPCLDRLREELSCAVCLDICFEPSTISCGHSFCGTCLRSVLKNCGPRCPKCRQTVRIEASRKYQINTVLWNTIQILFPQECAAKLQDQKQSTDEDNDAAKPNERPNRGRLGTRLSRVQPWRSYESANSSDPTRLMENLSTSFLSASEWMLGRSRERINNHTSRHFDAIGSSTRQTTRRGDEDAAFQESSNPSVESIITRHRRRAMETVPVTQEEIDEDLAMKLQQAELDAATARDRAFAAVAATRRMYQQRPRQRS